MTDFTAAIPVLLRYETVNGDIRTDKGGRALLWKQNNRRYLLTVQEIATYSEIKENETLKSVVRPQLKPGRNGTRILTYANIAVEDIPTWTRVPYPEDSNEEESIIQLDDDVRIDLRVHDHIYYLDVTDRAWTESPQLKPLDECSMQVSLGDVVRFATQRRLGTGFLSEWPQWRPVQEIDTMAKETRYPGTINNFYSVGCSAQIPPVNITNCKGGQVAFAFPSQVLNDYCYKPPMFLIDINVKGSSTGWPVLNEDNEVIGLVAGPHYVTEARDKCLPGTWVCSIPAGLQLPEPLAAVVPKPSQPKKKSAAKKKKAKGKKRK